jgi:hypothetical protein
MSLLMHIFQLGKDEWQIMDLISGYSLVYKAFF